MTKPNKSARDQIVLRALLAEKRINLDTIKQHHGTERLGGAIRNLRDQGWQIRSEPSHDPALAASGVRDYVLISSLPGRPSTLRQDKIQRMKDLMPRGASAEDLFNVAHATEKDLYPPEHFRRWTPERIQRQKIIWDALENIGRSVAWVDINANGVFTASVEHGEIEIDDVALLLRAVRAA